MQDCMLVFFFFTNVLSVHSLLSVTWFVILCVCAYAIRNCRNLWVHECGFECVFLCVRESTVL